jgi:hypothetical protein
VLRDYPADARFPCSKPAVLGKRIQKHPVLYKLEEEEEEEEEEEGVNNKGDKGIDRVDLVLN